MPNSNPIKRSFPARAVAERYGLKAARSLRRWVVAGIFPPADRVINGRNYWWEETLTQHERRLVAETAAKKPTTEISPTA